ncbi:BnaCnng70260D [Brassica napus]|uniref:BnaCnng70260D protein n=1 Tax=Brassica napus TaxID=3708 RepID=A0A078JTK4_BRANA|nr:BnaCnng70260D [Brassica napus]
MPGRYLTTIGHWLNQGFPGKCFFAFLLY